MTQAQKINESTQYHIKPATGKIHIDGNLDDAAWKDTQLGGDFWMITPTDTAKAQGKTEFRFTYDEHFLYVAAICHESIKNKSYIVESLKRDFNFGNNDNLWLILEPFNDLTNGFVFGPMPQAHSLMVLFRRELTLIQTGITNGIPPLSIWVTTGFWRLRFLSKRFVTKLEKLVGE
jgi:hypothetical protein